MKKNPHILANEIRQGNDASFELFFKTEFDNLVYFINGYLHDGTRAKDTAQESLWMLWEKCETIDPGRNIRALPLAGINVDDHELGEAKSGAKLLEDRIRQNEADDLD